ncbi:MAG: type II toxin-antitoxin system RelE/ParE family toxin [Candidatus Pacebacteria bacterium]|nr:type II toxin-antitoxin system RelE/ParE family toxin [Candidatus Paceibacterota bacterium]
MIKIIYAPIFVRQFKKLNIDLQDEVLEKIELFKDASNHKILKVHKLNGIYKNCFSFSVNYSYRIIFQYENKKEVAFLSIGDHGIYK